MNYSWTFPPRAVGGEFALDGVAFKFHHGRIAMNSSMNRVDDVLSPNWRITRVTGPGLSGFERVPRRLQDGRKTVGKMSEGWRRLERFEKGWQKFKRIEHR